MKARWVLIYGALLLSLTTGVYGDGSYQRTKDGKTFVWDNYPKPHEAAAWSGDRDTDGYATGSGTLTWYTVERKTVTGTNLPDFRYTVIGSFTGNMVRGKFDGPVVDLDPNGNKFHAKFVDGRRASGWAAGPAPIPAPKPAEPANQEQVEPVSQDLVVETEPSAPAEEPPLVAQKKADQPVSEPAVKETRSPAADDSLESLISVPSFLRMSGRGEARPQASIPPAVSSQPAGPHLTQAEVINLADAEASAQGYNLSEYQRPRAKYTAEEETWSVAYDSKSVDANGMGGAGKHFSVNVKDNTKKTSVESRK